MRRVATRQASAQAREERDHQAEEAAWLRACEERFFLQVAQAAVEEHWMQAPSKVSLTRLCARLPMNAMLMLTCDPVHGEEVETLKRKRQDDLSRSASRSASLLMTWAERLPDTMPQPPLWTTLTS